MAIREYELDDGEKYFFFAAHKFPSGSVSIRLLLMKYIYEHQYRVGGRCYKFKILKDYFDIWPGASVKPPQKPGDLYQVYVLKHLYKENYKTMKRRFVRTILGPKM